MKPPAAQLLLTVALPTYQYGPRAHVEIAMKNLLTVLAFLAIGISATPSLAHHGWAWTTGKNIELSGQIREVRLGNPHGLLKVDVAGEIWTVEVGQPWRNARAGLKDGDLAEGVAIKVIGEPSADSAEKRLKAERLFLGDREYALYPDRD